MPRQDSTPEQLLLEAAEAMKAMLPSLEQRRDDLQRELNALQTKIAQMHTVVGSTSLADPTANNWPHNPGMGNVVSFSNSAPLPLVTTTTTTHANQLTAQGKVAFVLEQRSSLTPKQVAEEIERRFKETIPMSTIYAALAKGRDLRKFVEDDGSWSLK